MWYRPMLGPLNKVQLEKYYEYNNFRVQKFKHSTENNKHVDGYFDSSNEAMTGTVLLSKRDVPTDYGGDIIHQHILL